MSHKYAGNIREGLLVNANAGGENVHRGELFGLVLGLNEASTKPIQDFVMALKDGEEIRNEIEAFVDTVISTPITTTTSLQAVTSKNFTNTGAKDATSKKDSPPQ